MNVICNREDCPDYTECFHGKEAHEPEEGCQSELCFWFRIKGRRQRCECVPLELLTREGEKDE